MIEFLAWCLCLRRCPHCGRFRWGVKRRRQSTSYENDMLNYVVSCPECYEYTEEYWREMWDMRYREVM